jgi:EmrB/QacA subfamily drug resistance transporter
MISAVNVALPSIGKAFAVDTVALSWVAMSYSLAAAMFLLPSGRLADITGRKRVFAIGTALYTVASLICGLVTQAGALVAFRMFQGIGAAMIYGTGTAILTSVYTAGERGRVLGLNTAVTYLGLSVGPFLGGLLTERWGWRSVFLVNVPLGVAIIVLVLWQLRAEWTGAKGEKFDLMGACIFGLALPAMIYGFSRLPAMLGMWLVVGGLIGAVAFVAWEMRVPDPLLKIRLFVDNRVFAFSNVAALISYSATSAIGFLLSLYLQYVKGFGPQLAGIVLLAQPAVQALFSPAAGRLSDRVEPRIIATAGMGVTVVGLLLLALLGQGTALWFTVACLLLLGFGFALFSSPNVNAIMGSVEQRFYGVASATLATMRVTGQTLSMAIATLLLTLYVGRSQVLPRDYPLFMASVRVTFGVFAALCFGGVFASLARGNAHD